MPDSTPAFSISPETGIALLSAVDQAGTHDYALVEKSSATRGAYRSDFAAFTAWCAGRALSPDGFRLLRGMSAEPLADAA